MGQAASYAESAIQRALLRLKTEEQQRETEVLALCGYHAPSLANDDEDSSSNASSPPGSPQAAKTGVGTKKASTTTTAAGGGKKRKPSSSTTSAASTPTAANKSASSGSTTTVTTVTHPDGSVTTTPAARRLPSAPAAWGPFVSLKPDRYGVDELREALHFLPDSLWVSLNRVSILYVLDGDLDGNFGQNDIAHFTDWVIRVVAPEVSSDQLAEVVQAHAALECWHRCLVRGQQLLEKHDGGASRISGAGRHRDRGGHSSLLLALTHSDDVFEIVVAPTSTATSPTGKAKKGTKAAAAAAEAEAEAANGSTTANTSSFTHTQLPPMRALQAPVTKDDRLQASVHFARWLLRMIHAQELARRRSGEQQRKRYREARKRAAVAAANENNMGCSDAAAARSSTAANNPITVASSASFTSNSGLLSAAGAAPTVAHSGGGGSTTSYSRNSSKAFCSPPNHLRAATPSMGGGGSGGGGPATATTTAATTDLDLPRAMSNPAADYEENADRAIMQGILKRGPSLSTTPRLGRRVPRPVVEKDHPASPGGDGAAAATTATTTGRNNDDGNTNDRNHVRSPTSNDDDDDEGDDTVTSNSAARQPWRLADQQQSSSAGGGGGGAGRRSYSPELPSPSQYQHLDPQALSSSGQQQHSRRVSAAAAVPAAAAAPEPFLDDDPSGGDDDSEGDEVVIQLSDREEVRLDALLAQGVGFYNNLHVRGWVTIGAVEELFLDLAVHESYGMPFWVFCRKLHEKSAREVEAALGLTPEEATRELISAVALEEARQRIALEYILVQRNNYHYGNSNYNSSNTTIGGIPGASLHLNLAVSGDEEEDAPRRSMSAARDSAAAAAAATPLPPVVLPVPSFIVSRYTLLCFIHRFVTAYWGVLDNMGFDPFAAEAVNAGR